MSDYDYLYYLDYEINENKVNTVYTIKDDTLEINFHGWKPDQCVRDLMKSVRLRWDPANLIWYGPVNRKTMEVAERICGGHT